MAVTIIDYGLGNVGSLVNIFKRLKVEVIKSTSAEDINSASHLILPGVGTFDAGIRNLGSSGILESLTNAVINKKVPVLGICLGAQLMLQSSAEGNISGLGWIKGSCVKFDTSSGIKIPHMGWNTLHNIRENPLFKDLPHYPPRFYFVHAFHFNLETETDIAAISFHGYEFVSSFRNDNIYGVQFHPEKSHKFGMQVLLNFSRI